MELIREDVHARFLRLIQRAELAYAEHLASLRPQRRPRTAAQERRREIARAGGRAKARARRRA